MSLDIVLIANRGEIAVRIIRTLHKMKRKAALVFHAADKDSLPVDMADYAIEITGDTPVAAYLDMDQILAAAKSVNADAIHPGFGFLSENSAFVRRVKDAGLTFIGPDPEVIDLMGNKIGARAFCIEHGHPIAPSVTDECSAEEFIAQAKEIGTPLLIKAAAGGGGKGMHIVEDNSQIEQAIKLAKGEAARAFGDDQVYAERYITKPRHIEVQILADNHGNVVHLYERECSIQRRFQKVVEEAPSPAFGDDLRHKICMAAVEIARTANYKNAGTVEFILAPDGEFYFLEMNTRIQVEHPITEEITGVDIVEQQIRIAEGEALSFAQDDISINGHAIELRLYAEDADNDFAPATGTLHAYRLATGVRFENGFKEGNKVTSAFDPMLAKIVVRGTDRTEATSKAVAALRDTCVLGVTTNSDFMERVLLHPAFISGDTHTGFIKDNADSLKAPDVTSEEAAVLLSAAALSSKDFIDPDQRPPAVHQAIGNWRK